MTPETPTSPPARVRVLTSTEVRARMERVLVGSTRMRELSDRSGVGYETIRRIRMGIIANPGIDTVAAFWPYIEAYEAADAAMAAALKGLPSTAAEPPPAPDVPTSGT